jgi:hypothetical protein
VNQGTSAEKSNRVPFDEKSLINTTIRPEKGVPQIKLIQLEQSDKHGHIYQAKQTTGETLFQVRVYCFAHQSSKQRRSSKRNYREWKERRRFETSCQENGLVFVVLRYPKSKDKLALPPDIEDKDKDSFALMHGILMIPSFSRALLIFFSSQVLQNNKKHF